jgi:hypothetical protein
MPPTSVFRAVQRTLAERVKSTPPHALNDAQFQAMNRILPAWITEGSVCRVPTPIPAPLEPDHA